MLAERREGQLPSINVLNHPVAARCVWGLLHGSDSRENLSTIREVLIL
ncbi:hypothetical protein HALA3H3_910116 [Halomonas sp. A3H3]|nr:conserved hypothetical protein [Halomonas sp. 156]CAD5287227.1 conserved hypothetical protein [Halomonas sp. 113]CAD5288756.1 conserved hypothetical protein [Halomonas sp. 59]CAD5291741.1 conserved hypothetical protein [Halomonas sp. I3]CDG55631.1 hypothetical protein HALA3H3_910116 [Halomonas sp. A3H3]VXB40645.1 conserved hypothetical protein [Halomonas titanicae]